MTTTALLPPSIDTNILASKSVHSLIEYLLKHTTCDRLHPFPVEYLDKLPCGKTRPYKVTSHGFIDYTKSEYERLMTAIRTMVPGDALYETLVKFDLSMVLHTSDVPNLHGDSITEYEFRYSPLFERQRLRSHSGPRWYLFHGSHLENWYSILRNGIKNMSKTKFMTTGAVHGNGIYLSDSFSFSQSYGSNLFVSCVAVVELTENPEKYKKCMNVFVVPDENAVLPRYLFIAKGAVSDSVSSILDYYKKLADARSLRVLKKRLERDCAALQTAAPTLGLADVQIVYGESPYVSCTMQRQPMTIHLDGYPNLSPLFVLNAGSKKEHQWMQPEWVSGNTLTQAVEDFILSMATLPLLQQQ